MRLSTVDAERLATPRPRGNHEQVSNLGLGKVSRELQMIPNLRFFHFTVPEKVVGRDWNFQSGFLG